MRYRLSVWCGGLIGLLLAGCGEKQYEAPSTGTYGAATNMPLPNISAGSPDHSGMQPWTNGELAIIQTELSPATLCRSKSRELSFFTHMRETGLGGPTFAAISTEQGPKIFKPGDRMEPARMRESWFVIWFAGAQGWTNWDSPWFLTLQHRPSKIRFNTNGLHFTFAGEAGYAALMPLYGNYKPLQAGQMSSPFATLKEKKKRVLTWDWHQALPADPLARARYWASALREFPIACDESVSIDRAHDSVTIQQTFRWLSWNDDWNTKHLKLAPLSPVLAHAFKENLPMEFSAKPFDMEIFTHYGPYYGIQDADSYRVTLPVLRYVHETAGAGTGRGHNDAPCFQAWAKAHASGEWQTLEQQWPTLRAEFRKQNEAHWPAFACANARSPLEQTAETLGAARIAYRLGDMDTYVTASHLFARALVQLSAQQRGINYFREHQPWPSMEPLGPEATLGTMTLNGWMNDKVTAPSDFTNAPDLARIWRDVLPGTPERRVNSPSARLERLIPGGPATPFIMSGLEERSSHRGLVQTVIADSPEKTTGHEKSWPRIIWPDWKTSTGEPWNFGQVMTSSNAPAHSQSRVVNGTTSVIWWGE